MFGVENTQEADALFASIAPAGSPQQRFVNEQLNVVNKLWDEVSDNLILRLNGLGGNTTTPAEFVAVFKAFTEILRVLVDGVENDPLSDERLKQLEDALSAAFGNTPDESIN